MSPPRFFLDSDDSGHWYLVPAECRADWEQWVNIDFATEKGWDAPEWAVRLDGHPNQVTFEAPSV